jgi:hypothetical protein
LNAGRSPKRDVLFSDSDSGSDSGGEAWGEAAPSAAAALLGPAGLDEGLRSLPLSNLLYSENLHTIRCNNFNDE